MRIITDDYGQVRVDDMVLPGIMEGMSIHGALRIDEAEVEGVSGTSKQPQGFDDAEVRLRLRLPNDDDGTPHAKCAQIVGLFRETDKYAQPFVCHLVNVHAAAWKIDEVLFVDLVTAESNEDDTMYVDLIFVEYVPAVVVAAEEVAPDPEILTPGVAPALADRLSGGRESSTIAAQGTPLTAAAGIHRGQTRFVDKMADLKSQGLYAAADTDAYNKE